MHGSCIPGTQKILTSIMSWTSSEAGSGSRLAPNRVAGQLPLPAFILCLSPKPRLQAAGLCCLLLQRGIVMVFYVLRSSMLFPPQPLRRGRGRRRAAPFNFTHERVPAPAFMLCTALFVCFSHFLTLFPPCSH